MKLTLITNPGKMPVDKVGGLIQVGESRELPAHLVQQSQSGSSAQKENPTGNKAPIFEPVGFLDRSILEIDDELGTLDLDQLKTLKDTETAGENRKGALEVIDAVLLAISIKLAEE